MSYLIAIIPSLLKKVPSDYYMATCFLHFKSLNVRNIIFPWEFSINFLISLNGKNILMQGRLHLKIVFKIDIMH